VFSIGHIPNRYTLHFLRETEVDQREESDHFRHAEFVRLRDDNDAGSVVKELWGFGVNAPAGTYSFT